MSDSIRAEVVFSKTGRFPIGAEVVGADGVGVEVVQAQNSDKQHSCNVEYPYTHCEYCGLYTTFPRVLGKIIVFESRIIVSLSITIQAYIFNSVY